jgi:RNA polymerase sigma-70 factor (ECF subfamily)
VAGNKKANAAERETFAREALVHLDHLYRVAFHLAKDDSRAQDMIQETFVRALASYEQFSPGTNMKAWLTRILYNLFFDDYQRKKRWASLTDYGKESDYGAGVAVENAGPESHVLRKELNVQISNELKKIPEEFRAPIVLVDMGDFSYEEAAEILSCPIGTIRSRLSRGRKLMQQHLRVYMGGKQEGSRRK